MGIANDDIPLISNQHITKKNTTWLKYTGKMYV